MKLFIIALAFAALVAAWADGAQAGMTCTTYNGKMICCTQVGTFINCW